jgi:SAM-dependent methyltransferase
MTEARFASYLEAKAPLDDRSLHPRVTGAFLEALAASRSRRGRREGAFRILEAGAGVGTMARRLEGWGALGDADYLLLDVSPGLLAEARRLEPGGETRFEYLESDIENHARRASAGAAERADAFVAHALLDLLDLPTILPLLRGSAVPGSPFWLSLVYDGLSAWEPSFDRGLEDLLISEYHASMEERGRGGSRSGRSLFSLLPRSGFRILEAGASDWVVFPREGRYLPGEAVFLDCILDFFEESLSPRSAVPAAELRAWLEARRAQVAAGEAIFLARNEDFLAENLDVPASRFIARPSEA